ncbi:MULTISPECIES: hypothetical protein [unclassified Streptomyces]|uniref:Uncharacterized protein n=1 Tax=Streptomyces sp. NBC_00119 TaxID=2975659 RepID=A0AAU1UKP1_9ACTN|nr:MULTISPECIES: hypothetical protein [unclassified Streptomyces]MCX4649866.1 hypothetical protein [Streptomyces sp. NBC_01446]MCX5320921.1 hypothetical protein [Streptomyces sp. NBC_00120]
MPRDSASDPILTGRSTEDLAQPKDSRSDAPPPEEGRPEEGRPDGAATAEPAQQQQAEQPNKEETPPLLTTGDAQDFRDRWNKVQSTFVDEPREAVQSADTLVTDVMQTLATTFADQKRGLEGQWKSGEEANTEDLRKALRHYRSFFNRLLTA